MKNGPFLFKYSPIFSPVYAYFEGKTLSLTCHDYFDYDSTYLSQILEKKLDVVG